MKSVFEFIKKKSVSEEKMLFILIDPDNYNPETIQWEMLNKADIVLVGGSIITNGNILECIQSVKKHSSLPLVLFPGNASHICEYADAILLLSLISGRNPELLIGQHVQSAFTLKKSKLEIISTGYMLIDAGKQTTVSYISGTTPLPSDKPMIAAATALAGEQLGLSCIYLDAGSGAKSNPNNELLKSVKENISIPLIAGGGINTVSQALDCWQAGADAIVIGTVLEKNPECISEFIEAKYIINSKNKIEK